MLVDVVLPNLGFGMEEGKLLGWLKQVGDSVRKGDPLLEVESDKASVELEAAVEGILSEILFQANQIAPVGSVLARIQVSQPVEVAEPEPSLQQVTPLARRVAEVHGVSLSSVQGTGPGGRIMRGDVESGQHTHTSVGRPLAAPAVRKLARERGIDLTHIAPSGSYGQVTRADVEAYLASAASASIPAPAPASAVSMTIGQIETALTETSGERVEVPLTPMRRAIARRIVQSVQEAPHFYATSALDLTPILQVAPKEIGITNVLVFGIVQALKAVPDLNATFEAGHLYRHTLVNLAIAVALPTGLIAPVLHHADEFSLTGLASRTGDLIARARENRLKPEELGGGTFTVSNLGIVKQVDHFTAIINPPQVGILAIGAAKPRPVVIDNGLHIRTTVNVTLSVDHRVIDGAIAGRFLEALDAQLENLVAAFGKDR